MRKLLNRVLSGSSSSNKKEQDEDSSVVVVSSTTLRSTSQLVRSNDEMKKNELVSELLGNAAQKLSENVQEILSDTNSLQENLIGFHRLLYILNESKEEITDNDNQNYYESAEGGVEKGGITGVKIESSLDILLLNLKHPRFVERCNDFNLATSLMHALRLLRMYEIKLSKSNDPSLTQGVTYSASKRLCTVFRTLMADTKTTEKLRQSLIKLVTFPLSVLPVLGIHLQIHSAAIISDMCRTGLTSQQGREG